MIMKFKNVYVDEWLNKNKKSFLITKILTMIASLCSDWHLEYQMSNDYDFRTDRGIHNRVRQP